MSVVERWNRRVIERNRYRECRQAQADAEARAWFEANEDGRQRDSLNKYVKDFKIFNQGRQLDFPDKEVWWKTLHDYRKLSEEQKAEEGKKKTRSPEEEEEFFQDCVLKAAGTAQEKPGKYNVNRANKKTKQWIDEQTDVIEKLTKFLQVLEDDHGISPPRVDWTKWCRDPFQKACGALLSASTKDKSLANVIMAMRKLDLLEVNALADGDEELLKKLQNLFLFCGYNYYTEAPAKLIGFARRVKSEFNGCVPENPEDLLSFYGIGRKVCMLILQDAFMKPVGIVCDRHVYEFLKRAKWTKANNADRAAEDVEGWLPPKYFRALNEAVAGIKQLWAEGDDSGYKSTMYQVAKELKILPLVRKVDPNFGKKRNPSLRK